MKKIVFILVIIISSLSLSAQNKSNSELNWLSWNEGYPLAISTGKILLIDTYTDWCGWCKRMDRDTYANEEVIKKINKHFIPVKFNPEKPGTYYVDSFAFTPNELHAQLSRGERTGYPTTYFINTQKKSVMLDPGYRDAPTFLQVLNKVIEDNK
ncbi:MAG: thioredoxin family protein [Bacteroidia bacterium]